MRFSPDSSFGSLEMSGIKASTSSISSSMIPDSSVSFFTGATSLSFVLSEFNAFSRSAAASNSAPSSFTLKPVDSPSPAVSFFSPRPRLPASETMLSRRSLSRSMSNSLISSGSSVLLSGCSESLSPRFLSPRFAAFPALAASFSAFRLAAFSAFSWALRAFSRALRVLASTGAPFSSSAPSMSASSLSAGPCREPVSSMAPASIASFLSDFLSMS